MPTSEQSLKSAPINVDLSKGQEQQTPSMPCAYSSSDTKRRTGKFIWPSLIWEKLSIVCLMTPSEPCCGRMAFPRSTCIGSRSYTLTPPALSVVQLVLRSHSPSLSVSIKDRLCRCYFSSCVWIPSPPTSKRPTLGHSYMSMMSSLQVRCAKN